MVRASRSLKLGSDKKWKMERNLIFTFVDSVFVVVHDYTPLIIVDDIKVNYCI